MARAAKNPLDPTYETPLRNHNPLEKTFNEAIRYVAALEVERGINDRMVEILRGSVARLEAARERDIELIRGLQASAEKTRTEHPMRLIAHKKAYRDLYIINAVSLSIVVGFVTFFLTH